MPELPEVETIVRGLQWVCGERVSFVDVVHSKGLIKNVPPELFAKSLVGRLVEGVSRRGKWIRLDMENGVAGKPSILLHLGMFGSLITRHKGDAAPAHERIRVFLSSGCSLVYSDMRSWGRFYLFGDHEADDFLKSRVGLEATQVTGKKLASLLKKSKGTLASFLMDQSKLAGIGNIYRSEIMWHAGLLPDRPTTDLMEDEIVRLAQQIRTVLEAAIQHRGSSISDYVDSNGIRGKYQLLHNVYGKSGDRCTRCPGFVRGEEMDGRKVYYCRLCQQ